MRKMLILLALAVLTTTTSGCSRCRNLFRRGAPCGGTTLAAPAMLGGAIPLGNPVALPQAPRIIPQTILAQPNCCCEQSAPVCCEPCPSNCVPCESGYHGGETGYVGGDCDCQNVPGEYFGGYLEGSAPPPAVESGATDQGSGSNPPYPTPGS